jgi:hypothetical protein
MGSDKPRDDDLGRFAAVRPRRFAALVYAALLAMTAWPLASPATDYVACTVVEIIVVEAQPDEAEMVCELADDALRFMQVRGMHVPPRLTTVHVVDRLSRAQFASTIGTFDAANNRIEVLTYEAAHRLMPEHPAFGVPMNFDLYRSFVAHELAHAIAHPNFVRRPVASAHEYIAYTVQLASMPPALRETVLRNVPTQAFGHPREIDEVMLAIDPNRFAVKSYLHFMRFGEDAGSFDQFLTGRFR